MSNLKQRSTKPKLESLRTDKRRVNNNVFKGSLIATIIALTPFLFYMFEYVPETEIWETFLFTYKSSFYGSARIGVWVIMLKLIPLLLLFLWFFTCRHWWYHAILVPIAMFAYQSVGAINDDARFFDEFQIIYLLPIMAIIIPSIYLIRAKMFNHINEVDKSMEELEEEFRIGGKGVFGKLSDYF